MSTTIDVIDRELRQLAHDIVRYERMLDEAKRDQESFASRIERTHDKICDLEAARKLLEEAR